MFLTIPTIMTWTRIVAIPLIVGVFYAPLEPSTRNLIATVMFVVFAATDWLDGYLARKLNQTSSFGAFLDPVADIRVLSSGQCPLFAKLDLQVDDLVPKVVELGSKLSGASGVAASQLRDVPIGKVHVVLQALHVRLCNGRALLRKCRRSDDR